MRLKKPTGKRPAMFYQDGDGISDGIIFGPRIRIVYPNGKIEWCSLSRTLPLTYMFEREPCYLEVLNRANNFEDALKIIAKFDEGENFPPMEFLGEL